MIYSSKWIPEKWLMDEVLTVAEARQRHDRREPYAVCEMRDENPFRAATLDDKKAVVYFFDHLDRIHLRYEFEEKNPGQLFLWRMLHYYFAGDSIKLVRYSMCVFDPNGELYIEKGPVKAEIVDTCHTTRDMKDNWEPYPAFGKYEKLFRSERDQP